MGQLKHVRNLQRPNRNRFELTNQPVLPVVTRSAGGAPAVGIFLFLAVLAGVVIYLVVEKSPPSSPSGEARVERTDAASVGFSRTSDLARSEGSSVPADPGRVAEGATSPSAVEDDPELSEVASPTLGGLSTSENPSFSVKDYEIREIQLISAGARGFRSLWRVEGELINRADEQKPVPDLRVRLKTNNGKVVGSDTIGLGGQMMQPGQNKFFSALLSAGSKDGTFVAEVVPITPMQFVGGAGYE